MRFSTLILISHHNRRIDISTVFRIVVYSDCVSWKSFSHKALTLLHALLVSLRHTTIYSYLTWIEFEFAWWQFPCGQSFCSSREIRTTQLTIACRLFVRPPSVNIADAHRARRKGRSHSIINVYIYTYVDTPFGERKVRWTVNYLLMHLYTHRIRS